MTLERANALAFGTAFFLLPLSKAGTFLALCAGAALLAACMLRGRHTGEARLPPHAAAIAVLALLPFTSLILHADVTANLEYLGKGYQWLLVPLVFAGARRADVTGWIAAFVGGTMLAWGAGQWLSIGTAPVHPVGIAALGNYILASQFLVLAIVCAALLFAHEPRPAARAVYMTLVATLLYGLATGPGRTGVLVALVTLPLIVSAMLPGRGARVVLAGVLLGATVLLASPTTRDRIAQGIDDVRDWRAGGADALVGDTSLRTNSIGLRLEMWRTAAGIFVEHPLAGAGPTAFQQAWQQRFPGPEERFAEPHNAYLFYAAAYGLPGLLALVAFIVTLLRVGWRHRDRLAGGVTLGFGLMVAVAALTNTLVLGTTSAQMLFMFAGLSGALWPLRPASQGPAGT
jgi:O-antigen ligase